MSYEEFLEMASEKLEENLYDRGEEVIIDIQSAEKLQGKSYKGISIRPAGEQVGMVLNLQDLYADFEKGEDMERAFAGLTDYVLSNLENMPKFRVADFNDYDKVRDNLMLELVSLKDNRDMLDKVPYTVVQDLALVYRVAVGEPGAVTGSILVTNQHLKDFGIEKRQLHKDALKNASEKFPARICTLQRKMFELVEEEALPEEMFPEEVPSLYFAAANNGYMGACCIVYPGFMENTAEEFGRSFYILPSSINEVLLLPETGNDDAGELQKIIRSVNDTMETPSEKLSDSLYHYDKDTKVFEKVPDESPDRERTKDGDDRER